MHYYGVLKQRLRHLISQRGVASLRDISNIIIINFLLHNYYRNSLIYTACIIYKYDRFILYRTATYSHTAIYSHTDQNARDATFIWGIIE